MTIELSVNLTIGLTITSGRKWPDLHSGKISNWESKLAGVYASGGVFQIMDFPVYVP